MSQASRRWPRFTLRTLFVLVTLVACWLAWEMNFIRQRKAFLQSVGWSLRADGPPTLISKKQVAKIPAWRRWLGDHPFSIIALPPDSTDEAQHQAEALFPEAAVVRNSQHTYTPVGDFPEPRILKTYRQRSLLTPSDRDVEI